MTESQSFKRIVMMQIVIINVKFLTLQEGWRVLVMVVRRMDIIFLSTMQVKQLQNEILF